jgi:hypothetical protein
LAAGGCAQPKYATASSSGNGSAPLERAVKSCAIRFHSSGYCLSWSWERRPTDEAVGSLVFKVYRANLLDGSPVHVDIPQPAVWLVMPTMTHGPSKATVSRIDVGTYRASDAFFFMPGEWQIRFMARDGATTLDEADVPIAYPLDD